MAKSEYDEIKKVYGEEFAKFCRANFPTILGNQPGKLLELLKAHLEPTKTFMEDLRDEEQFIAFINSFADKKERDIIKTDKSAVEICADHGYKLHVCRSVEDVLAHKKQYHPNDMLCTYNDVEGRFRNKHILFLEKIDFDDIHREDYIDHPSKHDAFGLSLLCVQIDRSSGECAIITHWNHTIERSNEHNPNCTLNNNLDNIDPRLQYALERDYGIIISNNPYLGYGVASHYHIFNDKLYRFNFEVDNVYYCANNNIINNTTQNIKNYNKQQFIVIDKYVFDKSAKTVRKFNPKVMDATVEDGFTRSFGEIKSITEEVTKQGRNVIVTNKDGKKTILGLNKNDELVLFQNPNIRIASDNGIFLEGSEAGRDFYQVYDCDAYYIISNNQDFKVIADFWGGLVCSDNVIIDESGEFKQYDKNRFIQIGELLLDKKNKKILHMHPDLTHMNSSAESFEKSLGNINSIEEKQTPDGREIIINSDEGRVVLGLNKYNELISYYNPFVTHLEYAALSFYGMRLSKFDCPNLKIMDDDCVRFMKSDANIIINVPLLEKTGISCFSSVFAGGEVLLNAPKWRVMGDSNFANFEGLKVVDLPSMEIINNSCFYRACDLKTIKADKVKYIGDQSFVQIDANEVAFPSLEYGGYDFLCHSKNLKKVYLPNVTHLGKYSLDQAENIETLIAPNLESLDCSRMWSNPLKRLKHLNSPFFAELLKDRNEAIRRYNHEVERGRGAT